jgi:hypothetical protein
MPQATNTHLGHYLEQRSLEIDDFSLLLYRLRKRIRDWNNCMTEYML